MDSISIVSEIVGASTALAGLILVYLGSLVASYAAFQPQERKSVRQRHQRRAWVAFGGFALALLTATLGLLGKWLPCEPIADIATWLFFAAFGVGFGIALMTVMEIR